MELAEEFITLHREARAWRSGARDLETIGRDIAKLEKIATPFPRISYDEAVKMLQEGHAKGELETSSSGAATSARPTRPISRRSSIGR